MLKASRTVQYKGVFKFSWALLLRNKSLCSLKLGPWRVYFMSSTRNYFHSSRTLTKWLKSVQQLSTSDGGEVYIKMERTVLTCMYFKEQVKAPLLGQGALWSFSYILWALCLFDRTNWFQSIALFSVMNCIAYKLSGRIQSSVWIFSLF